MTIQVAQAAGFAVGGLLVAILHPGWALRVDACSYLVSAAVIAVGVPRAARVLQGLRARSRPASYAAWWRAVGRNPRVRALFALTSLAGFFVVPEGLAVPYARSIGAHTVGAGLLLAAIPFGAVVGAWLVVRRVPSARHDLAVVGLAVGTGLPLLASALHPDLWLSVALWAVSGLCSAYQVDVITNIVHASPDEYRSRTSGLAAACLAGAQGGGVAVFGGVAEAVNSGAAIAIAAALGMTGALVVGLAGSRHTPRARDVDYVEEQTSARL
jgi:hypothetical protein